MVRCHSVKPKIMEDRVGFEPDNEHLKRVLPIPEGLRSRTVFLLFGGPDRICTCEIWICNPAHCYSATEPSVKWC